MKVLKYLTAQTIIMYLGRVVEMCSTIKMITGQAVHPYTKGLLAASQYDPSISIGWEASQEENACGCLFRERCCFYQGCPTPKRLICTKNTPPLLPIDTEHWAACHFWHEM